MVDLQGVRGREGGGGREEGREGGREGRREGGREGGREGEGKDRMERVIDNFQTLLFLATCRGLLEAVDK